MRKLVARYGWRALTALALTAAACWGAQAQDLKSFEQRTTTKVLPNGLTLIVCERPDAPVFSFSTFIDAGDVNDPSGESGLAHMFEHLAFKGTSEIGTKDWTAEKAALAKVEAANDAFEAERRKAVGRDEAKLKELAATLKAAEDAARQFVIPNQFTDVAERNGATGVNAYTALDETVYFWSMPQNRLELWAWLESARLADVEPREFYKERSVVMEERRMRTDSSPSGRLVEQFLADLERPETVRPERKALQMKLQNVFEEAVLKLEVLGAQEGPLCPDHRLESCHLESQYHRRCGPGALPTGRS